MASRSIEVTIVGDSKSLERAFDRSSKSTGKFGNTMKKVGLAAAAGVGAGLAFAVKSAVEFEQEMRNVNSIARLGEKQFADLSKSVRSMAGETGQAPKVLAQGMYDIVSSGFAANDAITILHTSAKAATAGLTDTATATKAVVASLNAYHLSARKAARVGDILFQIVNKGVLTFEELSEQIGDVLPSASTLGVPLEQVGGALATITLHGVNAAEAATQVKQVMISLLKPSQGLVDVFHKWGFESGQAAIQSLGFSGVIRGLSKEAGANKARIAEWFPNVRALGGFFGLAGKNLQTFTQNVDAMGTRGALVKAFAEQSKSVGVQWQKSKAAMTDAAISLGNVLLPAITRVLEQLATFGHYLEKHPTLAKALAIAVGVLAAAMIAGAAAATLMNLALLANPVGAVVVGIIALAAALAIAWKRSETFRNVVKGLWAVLRNTPLALVIRLVWNLAGGFDGVKNSIASIAGVVDSVIGKIRSLLGWLHILSGKTESIKAPAGPRGPITRALGGPVQGGQGYIVGEQGPEWFQPGQSGRIVPNHQMGGGGDGITVNVNTTFPPSERQAAEIVRGAVRGARSQGFIPRSRFAPGV